MARQYRLHMFKSKEKIWLLRNMKKSGLSESELIDAYKKEIRSLLELAVPVWHSGITVEQSQQIERVQKLSLAAILGSKYTKYSEVLQILKLDSLSDRRIKICSKFIMKNMKVKSHLFQVLRKLMTPEVPKIWLKSTNVGQRHYMTVVYHFWPGCSTRTYSEHFYDKIMILTHPTDQQTMTSISWRKYFYNF